MNSQKVSRLVCSIRSLHAQVETRPDGKRERTGATAGKHPVNASSLSALAGCLKSYVLKQAKRG